MNIKLQISSSVILFILGGCVLFSEEVATLKQLGKSQAQIAGYVQRQERLFAKLIDDFEGEKLIVSTPKSTIIRRYGEPVLSKEAGQPPYGKVLLYRHPMKYFDSDKLYLRFDEKDELIGWKYKPYKTGPETDPHKE